LRKPIPSAHIRHGGPVDFWAYGGDYGDFPNDDNFNCNGLVQPDRGPTPQLAEVRHCYQTMSVEAVDVMRGLFVVRNEAFFTSLRDYECRWTYEENGEVIDRGTLGRLDVPPRASKEVSLPLSMVRRPVYAAQVSTWNFTFSTLRKTAWAEAGHVAGRSQVVVPADPRPPPGPGLRRAREPRVDETEDALLVKGADFSCASARRAARSSRGRWGARSRSSRRSLRTSGARRR
jgi:beta-galactosidase